MSLTRNDGVSDSSVYLFITISNLVGKLNCTLLPDNIQSVAPCPVH